MSEFWQCKIQHSKVVQCNCALKLPTFLAVQAVSVSHYLRSRSCWTCRARCHVGEATSASAPQTSSRACESPPAHCSPPRERPGPAVAEDSSLSHPPTSCMCKCFGPGRRPFVLKGVARVLAGLGVGREAFLEKQEWNLRWVRPGNLQRLRDRDELRERRPRLWLRQHQGTIRRGGGGGGGQRSVSEFTEWSDGKHEDAPR